MYKEKLLSVGNLNFNFEETKKKVKDYFMDLEKAELEYEKVNAQKGLTANYDFSEEYQKQPFIPIGKDEFGLAKKDNKEEELKKYLSTYHWAISILSDKEQIYISECFVKETYGDELVSILGLESIDSREYRRLKKSAVYKFAYFLNLVVEK